MAQERRIAGVILALAVVFVFTTVPTYATNNLALEATRLIHDYSYPGNCSALEQLRDRANSEGDVETESLGAAGVGRCLVAQGELERAAAYLDDATRLAEAADSNLARAYAHYQRGALSWLVDDLDSARTYFRLIDDIPHQSPWLRFATLNNLIALSQSGDDALEILITLDLDLLRQEPSDPEGMKCYAIHAISDGFERYGYHRAALPFLREAKTCLDQATKAPHWLRPEIDFDIFSIEVMIGERTTTQAQISKRASGFRSVVQEEWRLLKFYQNLGQIYLALGEPRAAFKGFNHAAELANKLGWRNTEPGAYVLAIGALIEMRDFGEAKARLESWSMIDDDSVSPYFRSEWLSHSAEVAEELGDEARASELRQLRSVVLTPWLNSQRAALLNLTVDEQVRSAILESIAGQQRDAEAYVRTDNQRSTLMVRFIIGLVALVIAILIIMALVKFGRERRLQTHVDELYEQARRLAHERDDRSQELAMLVHDIASPLSVMFMTLELLGTRIPPKNRVLVEQALDTSKDVSRLLNSLTDVVRGEQQACGAVRIAVDLGLVCLKAIDCWLEAAQKKQLTISFGTIVEGEFIVQGDQDRLERVVDNLLSNAIKYSMPGGVVELVVERKGEKIQLAFHDEGIGATSEGLEQIFSPFSLSKSVSKSGERKLGLGLFPCQRILQQLEGEIWAESEGLGKGLSIFAVLPSVLSPETDNAELEF